MDSLDLLRSLTNGVNSKVSSNSSETEGVSYKVQTSLRGRKKGDSPIQSPSDDMKKVRDTYKEEKIEEIIEEEIIEEEIIEEEIIEEEIIEEEILEENYSESYNEPSFNDDEPIFEIETDDVGLNYNNDFVEEIIEEVVEEVVEEEIEDISEHANIPVETTKNENEHKLEDTEVIINEPIINTTEKKKIDRCGNPFKRGPRNKNKEQKNKPSKVQQVLSELKEQEKLEKSELVSNAPIEEIDEVVVEKVEEPVVIEPIIEEVSSNSEIEDMLLQSVFDELQDELDISEEVEEPNNIEEETEEIEEEIEEIEEEIEEIPKEEEISVESEIEDISIEEISKPKKVENVEKKVPKKTEKVAFEEVVFGEDVDFSFDDMDKKEEVSQVEDVNETDDKFKNCKYYGGMSVEEFLRENPNYREAMYVEYFYNKELLEELKMKGIILYKKGIYRL